MAIERRRNYIDFAIYIQKFNDFIEATKDYRKAQEARQDAIKTTLENNTKELLNETIVIKETLLKLPCEVHKEKIKNIDNSIRGLWYGLTVVIVGGIVFGVWMKLVIK